MRETTRRSLAAGLLLAGLAIAGRAHAQAPPAAPAQGQESATAPDMSGEIELTRAAIQVRRQAIVTGAMDLEPAEAERFWPVYREYRLEMARVGDRLVKVITTYLENYETLSDQMASRLLDDYLGVEKARAGVKAKFVPRFRKALPARKVVRFFQVDNKLDAVIQAELAADIPLLR
jgi:hypothetical protein